MKTLLILFALLSTAVTAQNFCETKTHITRDQKRALAKTESDKSIIAQSYTVRVFFHFVKNDAGRGGQDPAVIPTIMGTLLTVFGPHHIYFKEHGHDLIPDTDLLDYTSDEFSRLTTTKFQEDAINVYLLANDTYHNGDAGSNPSLAFVIGGKKDQNLVTSKALAHEMGHCLGLFHTFDQKPPDKDDASNCLKAGDWCCDTLPDNEDFELDPSSCQWTSHTVWDGRRTWLPTSDPTNIMTSIPRVGCYQSLTADQGDYMRRTLAGNSLLKPALQ